MGSTKLAARQDYEKQLIQQVGYDRATLILQGIREKLPKSGGPDARPSLYEAPGALPSHLEGVHERVLRQVAFRLLQRLHELSDFVSHEKVSIRTGIPKVRLLELVIDVRGGVLREDAPVGQFPYPSEQAALWDLEKAHYLLDSAAGTPNPVHPVSDCPGQHHWPRTEAMPLTIEFRVEFLRATAAGIAARLYRLLPILSTGILSQLLQTSLPNLDALFRAAEADELDEFLALPRQFSLVEGLWRVGHSYRVLNAPYKSPDLSPIS